MACRHLYLFAYDISAARTQNQVRRMLRAYAVGGQKSLFECLLTDAELHQLCMLFRGLLGGGDRLHVFRLSDTVQPIFYGCAGSLAYDPFVIG
ncbi:CRISPR-associated endonuclease Cas2 [Neisseria leonii]|uniref:CRISPR-associated endoribonuclease Cas2 n=2 Tax=Neisseria leonii TaxID=2995413 RepID=A0A9X4ID54_9NEIS|nr:CRISPR-associated endonuclease Cas2 [Neisseria sp. 51.81]MDD9326773.1 CRISPR-associated endonuclease Cas2 [Neisseria sp. 51.81]